MTPNDRKYTPSHEWVKLEGGVAVVGITDHAQRALGDLTFLDLPPVGKPVAAGKEFGVVESVKAASDLFAPVGGVVAAVNAEAAAAPEIVNQDPYGRGWLITLKDVQAAQLEGLLDAAAYDAQCAAH